MRILIYFCLLVLGTFLKRFATVYFAKYFNNAICKKYLKICRNRSFTNNVNNSPPVLCTSLVNRCSNVKTKLNFCRHVRQSRLSFASQQILLSHIRWPVKHLSDSDRRAATSVAFTGLNVIPSCDFNTHTWSSLQESLTENICLLEKQTSSLYFVTSK